jgi:exodeoxyribonuclease VII large subunit
MGDKIEITVGQLTHYLRQKLEGDMHLRNMRIKGEISNLTIHTSGHWYFTLKDTESQVSCVMFKHTRTRNQMTYIPRHGDQVILTASISVYVPRGSYQLQVEMMQPAGAGDLNQQFLQLKQRLQDEGLFALEHKQSLPPFPEVIGVITSMTGAVLRDILQTLKRRWPAVRVHIVPSKVQGEDAAEALIQALDLMLRHGKPDVIIMGRGGGSMEDLWAFNNEVLARAVYNCPIPIISAVGHETDFTILDFVADMRAATPTAAAELAVPNRMDYISTLQVAERIIHRETLQFTLMRRQMLDDYAQRMQQSMRYKLDQVRMQLRHTEQLLQEMDMRKIMERGFALVQKGDSVVTDAQNLQSGDSVHIIFHKGAVTARIDDIQSEV